MKLHLKLLDHPLQLFECTMFHSRKKGTAACLVTEEAVAAAPTNVREECCVSRRGRNTSIANFCDDQMIVLVMGVSSTGATHRDERHALGSFGFNATARNVPAIH